MADLNEEITLSNRKKVRLSELVHVYVRLVPFVTNIAKGSTADHGSTVNGYESRLNYAHRVKAQAERLVKELGLSED